MSFILANFLGPTTENSSENSASQNHMLIEKICSKMVDSAHLEDRRAAAQSLKSLVRSSRLDIGTICLQSLLDELKRDLDDVDTAKAVLETLDILCSSPTRSSISSYDGIDDVNKYKTDTKFQGIEDQFCEILLKDNSNVSLFLDIVSEPNSDFYLKFTSIQLLVSLCNSQPVQFQCAVLAASSGVSKILSLLEDEREVVRNEGIILAKGLVRGNSDLQKIVTFQGACEMVMKILVDEGGCWDGPLIVHDSLQFLSALLEFNTINQNYFRDSICFKQLAGLLAISSETDDALWNQTRISNYSAALDVFSVLLCRDNVDLEASQNVALQTNYLIPLLILATNPKIPISISSSALNCLSSFIWTNLRTQSALSKELLMSVSITVKGLVLPCSPLMAAVLIALHGGISPECIEQRQKALLLIEAFCTGNPDGQLVILSTMLKSESLSIGSAIIDALLDTDASRKKDQWHCWFASNLLGHLITENESAKGVLLKHQITDEYSEFEGESIFNILMLTLIKISRDSKCAGFQKTVIAYLSLLTIWLNESPLLIGRFLQEGPFVQYLIERVTQSTGFDIEVQGLSALILGLCVLYNDETIATFTSEGIKGIIKNRIGPDLFISRITRLRYNRSKDEELISSTVEGILIKTYDSLIKLVGRPTPAGTTASHTATLAQLTTDLTSTRTLLIDTQSLLSKSNSLVDTLKIGIVERDTYISQLQKFISEKNQRLTQMAHDISRLEQEQMQQVLQNTAESAKDVLNDDTEKSSLIEQVNQYYQQYLYDQSAIETLNQSLQSFQETINHQQARIEELEHLLALSKHQNEPSQELEEWKRAYHELYDQMQEQIRINNDALYYENARDINSTDENQSTNGNMFSNEEIITKGIIELIDAESVQSGEISIPDEVSNTENHLSAEEQQHADSFVLQSSPSIDSFDSIENNQEIVQSGNFSSSLDASGQEHVEILSPSQFLSPLQEDNQINEQNECFLEKNISYEPSFEKVTFNVVPEVQEVRSHYPFLPVDTVISQTSASIISEESALGVEQAELVTLNELPDPNKVNFEPNYPDLPMGEITKNQSASIVAPLESGYNNSVNVLSDEIAPESFVQSEDEKEIVVASNQEIEQVLSFFDNLSVVREDTRKKSIDNIQSTTDSSDVREESSEHQESDIGRTIANEPEQSIEKPEISDFDIYKQAAERNQNESDSDDADQQQKFNANENEQTHHDQLQVSHVQHNISEASEQFSDQSYEQTTIEQSCSGFGQFTQHSDDYSLEQNAYQSYEEHSVTHDQSGTADQFYQYTEQPQPREQFSELIQEQYNEVSQEQYYERPQEQYHEHSAYIDQKHTTECSSGNFYQQSTEQTPPSYENEFTEQSFKQSHEQPSYSENVNEPSQLFEHDQSYEQQPLEQSHNQSFEQPSDRSYQYPSDQSYEYQQYNEQNSAYDRSYQQSFEQAYTLNDENAHGYYQQTETCDQFTSQPSYEQQDYSQVLEQQSTEQGYEQSTEQTYGQVFDYATEEVNQQPAVQQIPYGAYEQSQPLEQVSEETLEQVYQESSAEASQYHESYPQDYNQLQYTEPYQMAAVETSNDPKYDYSQYFYDESTGYTYGFDQNTNQYYYYDPTSQEYVYYTYTEEQVQAQEQPISQEYAHEPQYSYVESSPKTESVASSNPSLFTSVGPPMIPLQAKSSSLGKASLTTDEVFNI